MVSFMTSLNPRRCFPELGVYGPGAQRPVDAVGRLRDRQRGSPAADSMEAGEGLLLHALRAGGPHRSHLRPTPRRPDLPRRRRLLRIQESQVSALCYFDMLYQKYRSKRCDSFV